MHTWKKTDCKNKTGQKSRVQDRFSVSVAASDVVVVVVVVVARANHRSLDGSGKQQQTF